MKIKTVIFDIGNVLIGYDWDAYIMRSNQNDRQLADQLEDALFFHGIWNEVDRGVWSDEKILKAFIAQQPSLEKQIRIFWNHAGEALWQFDFTKNWIADLKERGYRVLYLSNWSDHMRKQAEKQLDFLPMMDGGVFSYEEKLIKPDPSIYLRIVEKYHLNAEECVFLDDLEANCKGAEKCGMQAIQVVDHETAVEKLEKILGVGEK